MELLIFIITILALGFYGMPAVVWFVFIVIYSISFFELGILFWIPFLGAAILFLKEDFRKEYVSKKILDFIRKKSLLPKISQTEKEALQAGTKWIESDFFEAKVNFRKVASEKVTKLTQEEQNFLNNEVETLCNMTTDWKIFQERDLSPEVWQYIKNNRFFGMIIPKEFDGLGFSATMHSHVIEKLVSRSQVLAITVMVPNSLGPAELILNHGTQEQKDYYLPRLALGKEVPCFALTEPNAGSDVVNIETKYIEDDDCYVISGSKIFITNGAYKGTGVVFATKDKSLGHKGLSAFIVDLSTAGVEVTKNEVKLGIRGSYTTAFGLDSVRVPKENLLANEGDGFKIAMDTLNAGRISIASQALGIAEGAFERSLDYSQERKQFNKPIAALQAISMKLADMKTRIEQSKMMVYKAAWLKEYNKSYTMESAIAKLSASETATYVTKEAVQIQGGYGFICEYEVERMFRDAKITEIYEGTSEIQRVVIGKMLMK